MRPQKESSPHELYLRAASAAKPMAPLKLYANVIGKFMVERQLGDKVTDKVRQQTMVAKAQHLERQAILLDQPPIPVPSAKNAKRKVPGSGTVLKKTPASDQLRLPSSSSRKVSPLPQNTPSSKANADVRRRLVHCLAITPRLADDVVRMVGGANTSASVREDLLALLEDVCFIFPTLPIPIPIPSKVAEQHAPPRKGDKSPCPWTLKPQTWTEVRPFGWPKLTESERIAMARQARLAFKALKIPESDPAWDNVRYRQTAPSSVPTPPSIAASNSSKSSTSTLPETKRSAITTKDAKLKSKQDAPRAKGEIQIKDESSKAANARVNAIKRAEADRPSTPDSAAKTLASRRVPGSGYQAKKSPQPSTAPAERPGTPVDPRAAPKPSLPASLPQKPPPAVPPAGGTHARKTIPAMPPKPTKKEDESDRERDREYERQREREREKRARDKEKQREEREREQERAEVEKREKARQKEREAVEREKRQREKEREREAVERERRQREKERVLKEKATSSAAPAFKRKTASQDVQDTLDDPSFKPKRRKLDDGTSVASSSSKARAAGLPAPKKPAHEPSPAPRLKMKKDPSPPQASPPNRAASGSPHKSERSSKASGSAKPRRRSPIYTSSEDEGEIPQPRKRHPSPPPVSDRSNSSDQLPSERAPRHHRMSRTSYPPPTDHAALRALYQSQYADYLGAFSKVVAQKRKIEAMLNGDSEAELDVMDPDDLFKLSQEHRSLKTELENIHDIYTKGAATPD
jgi:RNA polymerase II elongation factor ELL